MHGKQATSDSKRLKVLFLPSWYPSEENPIHGIFIQEHAKAAALYDDIVVLYVHEPQLARRAVLEFSDATEHGIRTIRIRYRRSWNPLITGIRYYWNILRGFIYLIRHRFRPDVIHAHIYKAGVPAVLLGWLYKITVMITEQCSDFPLKKLTRLGQIKARFALNHARIILPVSEDLWRSIERYDIRNEHRVIPNIVDHHLFYPPDQEEIPLNREKQILFAGLLTPVKSVPTLLSVLHRLNRNDFQLHIIGDGSHRSEYERLTAELDLRKKVTFHGLKPKADLAERMRQCDFLVLPSLYETFGVVLIEALASGRPVIAPDIGGPREIVTEEVGILVVPRDEEALAKAIHYMLDHHQQYKPERLASYARERYSYPVIGQQLHQIYLHVTVDAPEGRGA
ncbi:MAG: glycosyltransferase [Candidatus Neomarinimicrobiota bacterium]